MNSTPTKVKLRKPQSPTFPHKEGIEHISWNRNHVITLRHPGYEDGRDVFLKLPAPDQSNGGLDHATALIMCGLMIGNRWHGCFTKDKGGQRRLDKDTVTILPVGDYYFYAMGVGGPGKLLWR